MIRDLPSLKVGTREFKIGPRFFFESMCGRWDAKNNPRDYGIRGFVGPDYEIEEPYRGPCGFTF